MNTQDNFLLSLLPESDRRMHSITGAALALGLCLSYWFGTFEFIISEDLFANAAPKDLAVSVKFNTRVEPPKNKAVEPKPAPTKRPSAGGPRINSQGKPRVPRSIVRLNVLASRSGAASQSAYEMFKNTNINKDIDKVLRMNPSITQHGNTKLGEKRGRVDGAFNAGFGEGGSGGIGDVLTSVLGGGGPATMIGSRSIVGKLVPPKVNEISMGDGSSGRSAAEILQVVRSRTPGLRHIYNRHLKLQPGLAGKVTLRFTILPGGEIASCAIADNSTNSEAFAEEIRAAVARWTFKAIASGSTTVSVPFAFSE